MGGVKKLVLTQTAPHSVLVKYPVSFVDLDFFIADPIYYCNCISLEYSTAAVCSRECLHSLVRFMADAW